MLNKIVTKKGDLYILKIPKSDREGKDFFIKSDTGNLFCIKRNIEYQCDLYLNLIRFEVIDKFSNLDNDFFHDYVDMSNYYNNMYKCYTANGKLSARSNQCKTAKYSFITLVESQDFQINDNYLILKKNKNKNC